jgi:hypothetical protein
LKRGHGLPARARGQFAQAGALLSRAAPVVAEESEPAPDPTFVPTPGEFTGEWELALTDPDAPDIRSQLVLEMAADGRLRGSVSGIMGKRRLSDGKWDGATNSATFAALTDLGKLEYRVLAEEGGVLTGTVAVMGQTLAIRGERMAPPDVPIAGRWKGVIAAMNAEFHLALELGADGELAGRFKSSQSDSALHGAKWDAAARALSFEYDYPHLPVRAHLVGTRLVGTIGAGLEFEAEREED